MIHPDILIEKLQELGANFSKILNKTQIKFIKNLTYNMSEAQFLQCIERLKNADTFPKNLKQAFTPLSITLQKCAWEGCALVATLLNFSKNGQGFCSWHDDVKDNPENINNHEKFKEWRTGIARHKNSVSCNSRYLSEQQTFLNYFTWEKVNKK